MRRRGADLALVGVGTVAALSLVALGVLLLRGSGVDAGWQAKIADAGRRALTWADYDGWCTGYVGSIFRSLGVNVRGRVSDMANRAKSIGAWHTGAPRVGDIVFFSNTWDANRNQAYDDNMTHVGVILAVAADGTATFGHGNFSGGRTTSKLNMSRPADPAVNTAMRSAAGGQPWLAGQLVTGFATVRPEDTARWNA